MTSVRPSDLSRTALRSRRFGEHLRGPESRSLLLQSGLPHPFWCDAAQAFCALRNFADCIEGKKTSYYLRHGQFLRGFLAPFGASIEYKPGSRKEKDSIKKLSPRTKKGIFAGYHLHSGGIWSGVYLVYDEAAMRNANEFRYIPAHRVLEIVLPEGREFTFPAAKEGFFGGLTKGPVSRTS